MMRQKRSSRKPEALHELSGSSTFMDGRDFRLCPASGMTQTVTRSHNATELAAYLGKNCLGSKEIEKTHLVEYIRKNDLISKDSTDSAARKRLEKILATITLYPCLYGMLIYESDDGSRVGIAERLPTVDKCVVSR